VSDKRAETFSAFARRVAVSRQVISRAVASGRLARSVGVRRGRRCIVDVALALREWRENSSRIPHAPIRGAEAEDAPPRRREPRTILVPPDQFSASSWDDVILLARVRADGEPLYLMPMARQTAVALASALLELAETTTAKGRETGRKDTMTRNSRAPVAGPTVEPVTKP
jgi:hypothetical protein